MMQLIKVKEGRLHTKSSHGVGVTVAAGPPLLQVAVALGRHVPGYPDAGATVVHASRELVHRAGLVEAVRRLLLSSPPLRSYSTIMLQREKN